MTKLDGGDVQILFSAEGPLGLSLGGKIDATRPSIIEILPGTMAYTVRDLRLGMTLTAVQGALVGDGGLDFDGAMDAIRAAGRPLTLVFSPTDSSPLFKPGDRVGSGSALASADITIDIPPDHDIPPDDDIPPDSVLQAGILETIPLPPAGRRRNVSTELRELARSVTGRVRGVSTVSHTTIGISGGVQP